MLIKYCPSCSGQPYTTDLGTDICPQCGSILQSGLVADSSLPYRAKLPVRGQSTFQNPFQETAQNPFSPPFSSPFAEPAASGRGTAWPWDDANRQEQPANFDANPQPDAYTAPGDIGDIHAGGKFTSPPQAEYASAKNTDTVIRGRVSNYSNTEREGGRYRRFLFQRLWDAVVYGQRTEDVLHRFTVRLDSGTFGSGDYADIPVNVHGTISGGMQLMDNAVVEVSGRYRNGVLMARQIDILSNGYKNTVRFQHSFRTIFYGVLLIVLAALLIFIGTVYEGGFFKNIGYFIQSWLVAAIVITVLYILFSFSKIGLWMRMASGKKKGFPLLGILLVSLALTLVFLICVP